jgi:hypothetical protein
VFVDVDPMPYLRRYRELALSIVAAEQEEFADDFEYSSFMIQNRLHWPLDYAELETNIGSLQILWSFEKESSFEDEWMYDAIAHEDKQKLQEMREFIRPMFGGKLGPMAEEALMCG